jgi:RNA polymerase I-specific transcription initiation factor RRN3
VRGEFLHLADIFDLFQSPDLLEHLVLEDQKLASVILKRQQLQERRKRSIIQTAATLEKKRLKGGVGGLGRGSNPLDSFFPFDPYLLRRSYPYIEPYYRNWEGSAQVEDLTTSLLDDDNDEDIMLTDARNNEHISDDEDGSDSEDGESNEDTDDDDDDDNDEDSDQDDGEHMPLSLDTTADGSVMMHKPMSYTSTSSSLQNNNDKMATQRELWENELKRSRAASIGSGSW